MRWNGSLKRTAGYPPLVLFFHLYDSDIPVHYLSLPWVGSGVLHTGVSLFSHVGSIPLQRRPTDSTAWHAQAYRNCTHATGLFLT